jgi:hypothetical protein
MLAVYHFLLPFLNPEQYGHADVWVNVDVESR